jgi:hypothetical protein
MPRTAMEIFGGDRMSTKERSVMLNYLDSTSSQFLKLLDGTMWILTDWNQESVRILRSGKTRDFEFIINMDESGCADSIDPRKKKVVVRVMYSDGACRTHLSNCSQWNRAEAIDSHFEENDGN